MYSGIHQVIRKEPQAVGNMEPVSAVASIVGIISFTAQAVKLISNLKDFCEEFSQDPTKDFLHDLEVTAGILTDANVLAEKAKRYGTAIQVDYRADALSIQVDNCAQDLASWLDVATRYKKERGRSTKMLNTKAQYFNSYLTAIS